MSGAIVAHTRVGEVWRIGPPMGSLPFRIAERDRLLLVAGGTEVAPLRAMLEEMARRPENPRTELFLGARDLSELYALDGLRDLSYRCPWLHVVPVVEHDGGGHGAEQGTLADAVTRYGAWSDHDVVVSGSPAMIRATVTRMLVAGTPLDRIHYDPFTMA